MRCSLALVLVAACSAAGAQPAARPNIVYILCDDLGYGDVAALNPSRAKIKTPELDRLAAQGMTFTDAHSGSSVCTPTRYGVLTGRYAWRTRLQKGVMGLDQEPLIAADRLTVAGLLKQHGYHTACLGKWHLGFTLEKSGTPAAKQAPPAAGLAKRVPLGTVTRDGPTTRGFDLYAGFHHAASMRGWFENDRVVDDVEPIDMLPRLARRASDYVRVRAAAGEPFFLYLALNSPHAPVVPSADWQGRSGIGPYGDFVMETDWAVGHVLAALDRSGAAGRTLVIFTSDNGCSGPAAHADRLEALGHFASGPCRGYKSDIWEGGHRVPFFVRWLGKIKPGSRNSATICHTDLMATVAEILGVRLPEHAAEDSFSFLPELLGTGRTARLSTVHHSISGKFAIREDLWKLELCPGSGGWSRPSDADALRRGLPLVQLYDLAKDAAETTNLAEKRADVAARLRSELARIVNSGRSTPGRSAKNDAPIDVDKRTP